MPGNEVGRIGPGTVSASREVARGAGRAVGTARQIGGAGNPGLMRLLDVHAAASAGDILVVLALLKTIFFADPVDDARARVALFLVLTMVPFAILAPLIGPILDRFRHGRRFAMSASLAVRAVLAWVISFNVDGGLWLYVAAFGVVLMSRTYGVARSAALARLVLPSGLRLSQASARAAVFATVACAVAAAFGSIAAWIGPQWPLRLAGLVFFVGAIIALTLPPLADTEPPEAMPRPLGLPWRGRMRRPDGSRGASILSGRLVGMAVLGSGGLRLLYGFLLVFLAFAIRSESVGGLLDDGLAQLILVGTAFGLGTLIATVVGTALRVSRPVPLQATGAVLVALAALYATVRFTFISLLALCLFTALASGLAKVAVDATIQERIPTRDRANAFARTETLLMLVWLAGAGIGLVPGVGVRLGAAVATLVALVAMGAAIAAAWRMRSEVLRPASAPATTLTGVVLPAATAPKALPAPPAPVSPPLSTTATAPPPVAPPGYHVFHPSPPSPPMPSAPPLTPPPPEAPVSPPGTPTADTA